VLQACHISSLHFLHGVLNNIEESCFDSCSLGVVACRKWPYRPSLFFWCKNSGLDFTLRLKCPAVLRSKVVKYRYTSSKIFVKISCVISFFRITFVTSNS